MRNILKLKTSIVAMIVVLFVILPVGAFARTYERVVAFGDSLSDHGGLHRLIPTAPVTWSNGDVWVDYFTRELGNVTLENNAYGGAMTLGHESTDIQAMSDASQIPQLGLVGQVNTYISGDPSFTPSETLFTIWIGGNNLLKYGRDSAVAAAAGTPLTATDAGVMITAAIANVQAAIEALFEGGAVNILVLSLPDIGTTPGYNSLPPEYIAAATALSNNYNSFLKARVDSLNTTLSGISISYFDVFTFMNSMIAAKTFSNVTDTYVTLDANGDRTDAFNGPAEDYLFWDSVHPTTKAHEYVGKKVATVIMAEDDDDDDSCFISSLEKNYIETSNFRLISAFLIICLIAVFSFKKANRH